MTAYRTIYVNAKSEPLARASYAQSGDMVAFGDLRDAERDRDFLNSINPRGALPFQTFRLEVTAFATQDGSIPKVERVTLMDAVACIALMFGGVGIVPVALWIMGAA